MSRMTQSARGEECTLQIFGICNRDWDTTVLCHIRVPGTGIGMKPPDWQSVYACSACHEVIDRRAGKFTRPQIEAMLLPALIKSTGRRIELGLIEVTA